jgi:hypothetical protein
MDATQNQMQDRSPGVAKRQLRTSLYLAQRADAMLGTIRFFAADSGDGGDRRLQFLAQHEFWSWKLDNLVYSFASFAERQTLWSSAGNATAKIRSLGIAIDIKRIRGVVWSRGQSQNWQVRRQSTRVAPIDLLKQVLDAWNRLIDRCEKQFVEPMQRDAKLWGIQTVANLNSLRRSMPELSQPT